MIINFKSEFFEEGFCEGNITTDNLEVEIGKESFVTLNYTGRFKRGWSRDITLKTVHNSDQTVELVSSNSYCRIVHLGDNKYTGTYVMIKPFDRGVLF